MITDVYSDGPGAIVEDSQGSYVYYLRRFPQALMIDAGVTTWYHQLPQHWFMP